MNCEIVRARLSEYYDGELDPMSIAKFQAHLANCEVCECELSNFSTMSEMLRSADSLASSAYPAPSSWELFSTRLVAPQPTTFLVPAFIVHPKLAIIGAFALVASVALMVSLNTRMPPGAADHNHEHSHLGAIDIAIDFAVHFQPSQPNASKCSRSSRRARLSLEPTVPSEIPKTSAI